MTENTPISSMFTPATAPTGPSPAEASAKLAALTDNKEWGAKFMAGDSAARKEFAELTAQIAQGDAVGDALAGKAPPNEPFSIQTTTDGELPPGLMIQAAADLQVGGLTSEATAEVLAGKTFTAEEVAAAERWRERARRDPLFTAAWLKGDRDCARQMLVVNAIISAGTEEP